MIKKIIALFGIAFLITACGSTKSKTNPVVQVGIDLVNVIDDKVAVTIHPATITTPEITFYIPEIVPGTYSDDNYGLYLENFKALDAKGNELAVEKIDENSWTIKNATALVSVHYMVNDTYDIESTHEIFSPSGTNFKVDEQFLLNLHGLVGYFEGQKDKAYAIAINRPTVMTVSTTLAKGNNTPTPITFANTQVVDRFLADRYFKVIDNPVMYNSDNREVFKIGEIEIILNVYSPNNIVKAKDLRPNIERMMKAQKAYLGNVNATKKYAILLYLSSTDEKDAQGYGALEHHTSTVVVLPEGMPAENMDKAMIDVVAHEFFHIVTPLSIHSKEIHNFSFNGPKMSQHLWMYEGITEYFAQHFQVTQDLRTAPEFYDTILEKINTASAYTDDMSFTEMSKNILEEPYAKEYTNVYAKGALIGMCLDLLIRQESKGERTLLSLMNELSAKYGTDTPFDDDTIINEITTMTYPSVGAFLNTHVVQGTPIDYSAVLQKAGLELSTTMAPTGYFLDGQRPFISANQEKNEVFIIPGVSTSFFTDLGITGGDVIKSINGKAYTLENVYELISDSFTWKEGEAINFTIARDGKELQRSGKISQPRMEKPAITELQYFTEGPELRLRKNWLQGS